MVPGDLLADPPRRARSAPLAPRLIVAISNPAFDEKLPLDWGFNPKPPKQACFELHTLKFIAEADSAIRIGPPGTGKSHICKAIAYNAILQGYRVCYIDTDKFIAEHALSAPAARKTRLRPVIDADLMVLDDLFLSKRLPEGGAELLQSLTHQRYKLRRSLIVTSNCVIADWGSYLGDNTMATTLLDRLMHRSPLARVPGQELSPQGGGREACTPTEITPTIHTVLPTRENLTRPQVEEIQVAAGAFMRVFGNKTHLQ